jgi:hemerythrin-like metal-binding protein
MSIMSAGEGPSPAGEFRHESAALGGHASAYLQWIDIFETGNTEIDALHRCLLQDCNSLLLLVECEVCWLLILAQAKKLVEDCIRHFRAEEALLERTRFPRWAEHAAEHHRLEREMQTLVMRMEQVDGSLKEHREYPKSLGPSLIDLIVRHDLDYRSHLLHQQVAEPAWRHRARRSKILSYRSALWRVQNDKTELFTIL